MRLSSSQRWAFVVVLLSLICARVALAQEATIAEQLFREGKRLLAEGKTEQACKAFEGSFRKDAALTTLLNLADCREKNGQYATAWGHFLNAERLARGKPDAAAYRATAKDRATKLEERLSYLVVRVPSEMSIEGLTLFRNGSVVDPAEWNTPIPVDGGVYKIKAEAPGHEPWSTDVSVRPERDNASVTLPSLRALPKSAQLPSDAAGGDPVNATIEGSQSRRSRLGLVVLAGGGVMLVAGLSVGYLAQQKYGEAEALCGSDRVCDTATDHAAARDLTDQARLRGNISTAITAAGVAAVGVGAFLWIRSGRVHTSTQVNAALRVDPLIGRDVIGLAVGGNL